MLVITRKNDESIQIGENIKIIIIKAANNMVKIGIEAPKEITITRTELLETITANQEATSPINNMAGLIANLKGKI